MLVALIAGADGVLSSCSVYAICMKLNVGLVIAEGVSSF